MQTTPWLTNQYKRRYPQKYLSSVHLLQSSPAIMNFLGVLWNIRVCWRTRKSSLSRKWKAVCVKLSSMIYWMKKSDAVSKAWASKCEVAKGSMITSPAIGGITGPMVSAKKTSTTWQAKKSFHNLIFTAAWVGTPPNCAASFESLVSVTSSFERLMEW